MRWLEQGRHGAMDYMQRHGRGARGRRKLIPGTLRVIAARMDYLPPKRATRTKCWPMPSAATCRATRSAATTTRCCAAGSRSSPRRSVRTAPRARIACSSTAGRCWRRRWRATPASAGSASTRTCCIAHAGSWFFLGEILTDLPLPVDAAGDRSLRHLPRVHRRLPDRRDRRAVRARRAALHLVSHDRAAHARFPSSSARRWAIASTAATTASSCAPGTSSRASPREPDFKPRHGLDDARLVELFAWSEAEFLARTEGSAIRRIGYERWLRNIAVALGNAPTTRRSRAGARVAAR